MKQTIKRIMNKVPFIYNLREQVRKQGAYPAGHYYSPIPAEEDVHRFISSRESLHNQVLGVDLNEQSQLELLNEYAYFYNDLKFPEKQTTEYRYYYDNVWFTYSDAIFLYSFLRKFMPKKIIEVGSGFSSAVILDTIDNFFPQRPEITFIEPYPDRLMSLLRKDDKEQIRLIDKKIQEVPDEVFLALESGDILFIDSSHVVKCGSDLHHLMFNILPRLRPGVVVHFHDIFYPFDYPAEWLTKGWYWNEAYLLQAFLSYNSEWKILFFTSYMHTKFGELIKEKMPLCALPPESKQPGCCLYIQRM